MTEVTSKDSLRFPFCDVAPRLPHAGHTLISAFSGASQGCSPAERETPNWSRFFCASRSGARQSLVTADLCGTAQIIGPGLRRIADRLAGAVSIEWIPQAG